MSRVTKSVLLSLLLSLLFFGQLQSGCFAGEPVENLRMRKGDDPELAHASQAARARWSEFATAFKNGSGLSYNVKASFAEGGKTEHMWVDVNKISGTQIRGKLNSDPFIITKIKAGDPVVVAVSQIEDWTYVDKDNKDHGNFTALVLQNKQHVK